MSTQQETRSETSGPSIGTIVWGAVVIVVGALMLANRLGWFSVDPGYAAAGILLLAGLGLVIGGIAASRRRRTLAADAAPVPPLEPVADPAAPHGTTLPKPSPYAPGDPARGTSAHDASATD